MDGDSPVSGANVVERQAELQQPIREVLQRHFDRNVLTTAATEEIRMPSLRVVLDSELHGRESFGQYGNLEEMLAAVRRLVESSLRQTSADGIERTVGIAITPPSHDDEDLEDANEDLRTG